MLARRPQWDQTGAIPGKVKRASLEATFIVKRGIDHRAYEKVEYAVFSSSMP